MIHDIPTVFSSCQQRSRVAHLGRKLKWQKPLLVCFSRDFLKLQQWGQIFSEIVFEFSFAYFNNTSYLSIFDQVFQWLEGLKTCHALNKTVVVTKVTMKRHCEKYLNFGLDLGRLAALKKYWGRLWATFEGVFFMFTWAKKIKFCFKRL